MQTQDQPNENHTLDTMVQAHKQMWNNVTKVSLIATIIIVALVGLLDLIFVY